MRLCRRLLRTGQWLLLSPRVYFVLLNSWPRIYGGIPPIKNAVAAADFEIADESQALLKGGFHYGVTRRGTPYIAPRPLMNHGPHRCMW